MVNVTHQMSIKVVHIGASLTTAVTLPGICVTVKSPMQKVERLIWENDTAMLALPLTVGSGGRRGTGDVFLVQR